MSLASLKYYFNATTSLFDELCHTLPTVETNFEKLLPLAVLRFLECFAALCSIFEVALSRESTGIRVNRCGFPRGASFLPSARQATPVARAIFMSGPPPSMPSRVAPLGTVPRRAWAYPGQAALIQKDRYGQIWRNHTLHSVVFCAMNFILST